MSRHLDDLAARTLVVVGLTALAIVVLSVVGYAFDVLLLGFAGASC
jgi:hypothetical protein